MELTLRAVRPLAAVLAAAGLLATAGSAQASTYTSDFEGGTTSPWNPVADPGIPSYSLVSAMGDNLCPSAGGWYGRLQAQANFMPGSGMWMFSRYPVTAGSYTVKVDWAIRNKSNCSTCRAIAYIGNGWVSSSASFTTMGGISSSGWTLYSQTVQVNNASGAIGVALGWKGAADNQASLTNVGIDCVRVTITP
jgi:hypothetical protein